MFAAGADLATLHPISELGDRLPLPDRLSVVRARLGRADRRLPIVQVSVFVRQSAVQRRMQIPAKQDAMMRLVDFAPVRPSEVSGIAHLRGSARQRAAIAGLRRHALPKEGFDEPSEHRSKGKVGAHRLIGSLPLDGRGRQNHRQT